MVNNFLILFFKKIANLKKTFFYIKIFFTIIFLSLSSQVYASSILGTGSGALLGGDLTDPENDGIDGTDGAAGNWNWTSIAASSDGQWGGEGAWNAFDNKVGGGDAKWCCNNPTQWVYVQFSQAYVLSHFTITSGNDVPSRDPDIWKIQGSNNGNDWTDIFSYNNDGNSPFSDRHQVIRYNGAGDDFDTPAAYSYFRYIVTSTSTSMHQINELEFFGTADSTAPTLSSSTPSDNATAIAADANIVLNFSESVDAESGNITIKKTSDNSTVETIDVTSGQVSGSGSSQITINPSSDLDSLTEYYVLIDSTAFDDSSSNSYAGISSTTALSFTTANILPTLSSSVPADNATSIAVDANIVLNFSESVDAESGNITIKKTSDNSTVETIDVTSGQVSGSGSSQITINPSSNLDISTEYYVLIDSTAFDDSLSGSYAGISSTTALSFTTTTNTLPTLSSSTPANNDSGVARDANIVLNFSESVDAESGNITIKKTSDNSTVETIDVTSGQVSGSGSSQITVNPSTNFSANTEYYVLVDASAFDDASSGSYAGISSTTALSFTVDAMKDPKRDKDVIGSIDTLSDQVKGVFTQSVSVVSNRLIYLRNNRTNNSFSNQNIKISFGQDVINSSDILDSFVKLVPISNQLPENIIPEYWSSWTEGTISMTKVGDQENSSSKEINAQGLAMGMDKKINDNELFGFSAHYTQSDTEIGTTGSAVDTQFYSVTAYGTKPHNNNNFIEGSFGIGLIKSDLVRKNGSNVLTGSRNGKQLYGSINYGKTIVDKEYTVIPRVRIDLSYTELDNYDESGTDALSYSDQTLENGLASLGLTINKETLVDDKKINRFGTFELGADFSNSSSATMHYLSDVSTTYSVSQGVDSNYLATSELGLIYDVKDNLKVLTSYKRIQGNNSEHTDTFQFSFHFKSLRETEYAVIMDATEYLSAGLNIGKNINGIDLDFNANQSFIKNSKKQANIKLSKKF